MGYEGYRGGRERGSYDRGRYGARDDYRSERGYDRGGYDRTGGSDRYGGRDPRGYDYDDRGFLDRAGDEVRSWFGDDDAERRRRADERHYREDYERDARRYGRPSSASSYPWYGGLGFEGYGVGVPPLVPPYGGYADDGYRAQGGRSDSGLRRDYDRSVQSRGRDEGQDPNYRSWRDRQMDSFDRDYDEYRREHQSQFDSHFGSWREQRQGQRQSLNRAQPHQEVVGSDGKHVGTVDHLRGDRILLTKTDKDAGGHHHSIPASWIETVDDKVKINKTAEEAQRLWKDEEQNSAFSNDRDRDRDRDQGAGAHNLDRAFRGTY